MPTRRRRSDTSIGRMFSPSSRISPSTRVWRMVSFIRFRVRRKVDLPQPEGPMKAVTWLREDLQVDILQRLESSVVEIRDWSRCSFGVSGGWRAGSLAWRLACCILRRMGLV